MRGVGQTSLGVLSWAAHQAQGPLLPLLLPCPAHLPASPAPRPCGRQDEDLSLTLRQLLATPRGKLEVAAELLALLAMAPFLLLEVGTLSAYGLGWLDAWNALDFLT